MIYKVWVCLEAEYDYIKADSAEEAFQIARNVAIAGGTWAWSAEKVRDYLSLACDVLTTAADVRPVVRGKWTHEHLVSTAGGCYEVIRCSERGWDYPMLETNYCPNCGADMRGDADGDKT